MAIDAQTIANLSPGKKALLALGVALVIVGLYWYLFYRGKAEELKGLRAEFSTKQAKLNENEAIARNLPKFKEEVEKLNAQLDKALLELPNEREIPNLLENLSNLGTINGLEVIFIKPLKDVAKGFYAEVPIQVKVRGGYHDLGMFLDAVAKLPRIITISNMSLGNPQDVASEAGKVVLDVNCMATTYRYVEKKGG